jgi:hypothetical protein
MGGGGHDSRRQFYFRLFTAPTDSPVGKAWCVRSNNNSKTHNMGKLKYYAMIGLIAIVSMAIVKRTPLAKYI